MLQHYPSHSCNLQGIDSSSSADEGQYHLRSTAFEDWSETYPSEDTSETSPSKDVFEDWSENEVEPFELDEDGSNTHSDYLSSEIKLRGAVSAALTSTSFVAGKAGKGKGKGKGGKGGKGKKGKKGKNKGKAGKHPGGNTGRSPRRCIAFGREAARRIAFGYCFPSILGDTQQLGRWRSDCRDVAIDVCQGSVATEVSNQCGLPRTRTLLWLQNQCGRGVRRMIRRSW